MMVRRLLFVFILGLFSQFSQAQTFVTPELSIFYGYGFASKLPIYDGYLRFSDAAIYGGAIAIPTPIRGKDLQVELSYLRQDTKVETHLGKYYTHTSLIPSSMNVAFNYFQLKGIHHVMKRENQLIVPYVGIGIGALWFENKIEEYVDYVRFSISLTGGAKVKISKHFGLRFEGVMNSPVQGAGLYFGVGSGGASTGVSTVSMLAQFGLSTGLIFYIR
jgi:hypothetical protein